MPPFLLLHQLTGQALYRITAASEDEIAEANRNLKRQGCPWRYAPDLHTWPSSTGTATVDPLLNQPDAA